MITSTNISKFYEKYRSNLDLEEKVINDFTHAQTEGNWVNELKNKNHALRQLYIENEAILNAYIRPFIEGRMDLDDETANTFLKEIRQMDLDGYYDDAVMTDLCRLLEKYYEKNGPLDHYISALNLIGKYYNSVYSKEDGKKAVVAFEKICSFSSKYVELEDFDIRKRILYAFYNRTIVKLNFSLVGIDELRKDVNEAIAFWNKKEVRDLDADKFDFDELIKELKYDVYGGYILGKDRDEVSKEVVLEAKNILEEYYKEALKECANPYDMLDEIYCNYNRCRFFLGEISCTEFIEDAKKYCDYSLEHIDKAELKEEDFIDSKLFQIITRQLPAIIENLNLYADEFHGEKDLRKNCVEKYIELVHDIPKTRSSSFVNDVIGRTLFNFMELVASGEVDFNTLLNIAISRDDISMIHSRMVSEIACRILKSVIENKPELLIGELQKSTVVEVLENSEAFYNYVRQASQLFDIGKIQMADIITKQTRSLTEREKNTVYNHPYCGIELIRKIPSFNAFQDVILGHHKSYDGKMGYPACFDNTKSPYRFFIELIHISDCIDAATDYIGRSYRKPKEFKEILSELSLGKGTLFHPSLIYLLETDSSLQKDLKKIVSEDRILTYYEIYGVISKDKIKEDLQRDWYFEFRETEDEKDKLVNLLFESSRENHDFVQAFVKQSLLTLNVDLKNGSYKIFSRGTHVLFKDLLDGEYQTFLMKYLYPALSKREKENLKFQFTIPELSHALVSAKGNVEYEILLDINGDKKWVRIQCLRLNVENKIPKNMAMIFTDVDEIHKKNEQLELALKEAYKSALEANKSKSNFLSNMSHDIRTPMNAIVNIAKLMKQEVNHPDELNRYLDMMLESSNILLGIINDVLDMSKIESGKISFVQEEVHLGDILKQLESTIQTQAREKKQTFAIHIHHILYDSFYTDRIRLYQILSNILSNAIKYTPSGGKIDFYVNGLPTRTKGHACIEFIVKDTGIGMSEEFLNRIYEPFTRQSSSTINKIQGTGLGMAITKNLVDRMGGTIEVQSKENVGTSVTIVLEFKLTKEDFSFEKKQYHTILLSQNEELIKNVNESFEARNMFVNVVKTFEDCSLVLANTYEECLVLIDTQKTENFKKEIQTIRSSFHYKDSKIVLLVTRGEKEYKEYKEVDILLQQPFFFTSLERKLLLVENNAKKEKKDTESVLSGMKFLCAEDNEINSEVLRLLLSRVHAKMDLYSNGKEVVNAFLSSKKSEYDAILMDVQMPIMNGYEATRKIRSSNHPDALTIPIIAMTANAFSEDIQMSLSAGMNDHLPKPIDMEKLEEIIAKIKK